MTAKRKRKSNIGGAVVIPVVDKDIIRVLHDVEVFKYPRSGTTLEDGRYASAARGQGLVVLAIYPKEEL